MLVSYIQNSICTLIKIKSNKDKKSALAPIALTRMYFVCWYHELHSAAFFSLSNGICNQAANKTTATPTRSRS